MKKTKLKHDIDVPALLLTLTVFALCMILSLLASIGAYRRLSERGAEAYTGRTCMQYVATRLRSAEKPGAVSCGSIEGTSVLSIAEGDYISRIYCYEGYLRELYMPSGSEPKLSAGEKLMELEALEFEREGDILKVRAITEKGTELTQQLFLRGGTA